MSIFNPISTLGEIEEFIEDNSLAFLYFSHPNCGVCVGLKPQIEEMLKKYPKIQVGDINTNEITDVAGRFSIFTVPVLILFVNGKEHIREARIVHTQRLDEKIARIYDAV